MAQIHALVNQKGGVGKTTTVINLAAWAALDGYTGLVVDTDPQGNATSGLGIDRSQLAGCIYDLISNDGDEGCAIDELLINTEIDNLDIIPATINLAGAELTLANTIARERQLQNVLEPIRNDYDFILVDTAPSLGILAINTLVAADQVIIPIQCEYYALEGLSQLLDVISLVQSQLNPDLQIGGAVLTMYDVRTNLSEDVADEVRENFVGRVYDTVIPRNVQLAEAPSHGLPAPVYAPSSRGAKRYYALYKEVFDNA